MSGTSEGSGRLLPSEAVQRMVERGYATKVQAHIRAGYIIYEFLGGAYDGVKLRLYPPFVRRIQLGSDVYEWGAPKNGRSKRLTYRLVPTVDTPGI